MLLVQISFHADFSVFTVLISQIYSRICWNLPADAILKQVLLSSIKSAFMIDISKWYYLSTFEMIFQSFFFFSLFQECSVVNTLVGHSESRTTSARWKDVYDVSEI